MKIRKAVVSDSTLILKFIKALADFEELSHEVVATEEKIIETVFQNKSAEVVIAEVELGRSCVDAEYRGGASMHLLWNGLAEYVLGREIEVMFGVASFHGTDAGQLAQALSFLHYKHLAPEDLRVSAKPEHFQNMDLLPESETDRVAAMSQTPALIKAYLRLGGFVGEGAFIDHDFNTIDVCLIMDTKRMGERYLKFYSRAGKSG